MIPGQSLDAAVIGGLRFLGKETARHTFIMISVMGYTFTAFSVPDAVKSAGTVPLVVTVLRHFRFSFLS